MLLLYLQFGEILQRFQKLLLHHRKHFFTAVSEGTCTITATTDDGLTATCEVTVTAEETEPTDITGDGTLFIELVDGNIKIYDVTSDEIKDFIDWYENRDLDESESPFYKFTKGDYKDYVIHSQIDWFEVR